MWDQQQPCTLMRAVINAAKCWGMVWRSWVTRTRPSSAARSNTSGSGRPPSRSRRSVEIQGRLPTAGRTQNELIEIHVGLKTERHGRVVWRWCLISAIRWAMSRIVLAQRLFQRLKRRCSLLQVGINVLTVGQIIRNGAIDLLQGQDREGLLDAFRSVAFQKGIHNRVERDPRAPPPDRRPRVAQYRTSLPWRTSPVPNQSPLRRLCGWRSMQQPAKLKLTSQRSIPYLPVTDYEQEHHCASASAEVFLGGIGCISCKERWSGTFTALRPSGTSCSITVCIHLTTATRHAKDSGGLAISTAHCAMPSCPR